MSRSKESQSAPVCDRALPFVSLTEHGGGRIGGPAISTESDSTAVTVNLSTYLPTTKSALVGALSSVLGMEGAREGPRALETLRDRRPIGPIRRPLRLLWGSDLKMRTTPLAASRRAVSFCSLDSMVRACLQAERSQRAAGPHLGHPCI